MAQPILDLFKIQYLDSMAFAAAAAVNTELNNNELFYSPSTSLHKNTWTTNQSTKTKKSFQNYFLTK
jgi:hypothetical protein